MKCAYCGKKNRPGAVVCKRCGIGLPVEPPEKSGGITRSVDPASSDAPEEAPAGQAAVSSGKKKSLWKPVVGVIAVLAAIAFIAAVILGIANSSGVILPARRSYTVHSDGVFYAGESVSPNEAGIFSAITNLDGTRCGILCSNGYLYFCSGGEQRLIAKEVNCFTVSANGKHLVYMDEGRLLWSCDTTKSDNAPVCVCSDPVESGFVVSPDGKTVLLNKQNDQKLYMVYNGKLTELGEGLVPISASNAGKNIYCYSPAENSIYYTSRRGKPAYLRSNIVRDVYMNSEHNELVFSADAGQGIIITMISVAGKEPVEIRNSGDAVFPVLPVSCIEKKDVFSTHTVFTCPVKSFDGKLFAGSGIVKYSAKEGSTVIDPTDCEQALATDDYGTVYFLSGGALSRMTVKEGGTPDRIVDGCRGFTISTNGTYVWYLDGDGALHCRKGTRDNVIASSAEGFAVSPNGRSAAFIKGGKVYVNKKGTPSHTYVFEGVYANDVAADAKSLFAKTNSDGWTKLSEGSKRASAID